MTTRAQMLSNFLKAIAKEELKDSSLVQCGKDLENIFFISENENYRISYSDVYQLICLIDSGQLQEYSNDVLISNIQRIKSNYTPKKADVSKSIEKLADHINLDVSRLNYTKKIIHYGDDSAISKTNSLETKVREIKSKHQRMENEYKNMQNQYITILGIFASVILAFVGGMTFSTSVFNNIAHASIYKLVAMAIIVGWIFFLLIWTLLFYIMTLTKNESHKRFFMLLFLIVNLIFIFGSAILILLKFADK